MSLETEMKMAMGYTEEVRECRGCTFSVEKDNPMLDRDWFTVCVFNRLRDIHVIPTGRCGHWEKRQAKNKDGAKTIAQQPLYKTSEGSGS